MDRRRGEIEKLRRQAVRGRRFDAMRSGEGWQQLEAEIRKMLEAFRDQGVSRELMGESVKHASIVGGYNALMSLLSIVNDGVVGGQKADARAEQMEEELRETERAERKLRRI